LPDHFAWHENGLLALSRRMTETDADQFRKEAEACRQQAEKAVSPLDKDMWLMLAADWLRLAEDAERPERHRF